MTRDSLQKRLESEINGWLNWLPKWKPPTFRTKTRVCRKCTGSPIAVSAGLSTGTPHQVVHALIIRIHRVIDNEVGDYVREHLPVLQAELDGVDLWRSGGYDAHEGLPEEVSGLDLDLNDDDSDQPVLFTFAELEQSSRPDPVLPMPPLNALEKQQLAREMQLSDAKAIQVGQEVCFLLLPYKSQVQAAVERFVEPQIQALLEELSRNLESPST